MSPLLSLVGILEAVAVILIVTSFSFHGEYKRLRQQGLWPQPGGAPTLEHVRRLKASGYKIHAIKLYRSIFRVGLKESKNAVEALDAGK